VNTVQFLYVGLVAVGFFGASTFTVMYVAMSKRWYRSEVGRILFLLPAVLAGLLGLSLLALLVTIWPWVWLAGMASLDLALWWLVWLLWRLRRGQRQPV